MWPMLALGAAPPPEHAFIGVIVPSVVNSSLPRYSLAGPRAAGCDAVFVGTILGTVVIAATSVRTSVRTSVCTSVQAASQAAVVAASEGTIRISVVTRRGEVWVGSRAAIGVLKKLHSLDGELGL